jgi:hypothetical protein
MISTLYFFEYLDRGNIAVSWSPRHLHRNMKAEKVCGVLECETLRLRQRPRHVSIRNRSRSRSFVRHAVANGYHDLLRWTGAFPSTWLYRLPRVPSFEGSLCYRDSTTRRHARTLLTQCSGLPLVFAGGQSPACFSAQLSISPAASCVEYSSVSLKACSELASCTTSRCGTIELKWVFVCSGSLDLQLSRGE